ncbi:ribonuclease R [Mycoplasma procyoni]|uniref:ribonuclease R n=1 Tax=Mycoplasma procyoni TaxID=568784 RepID=UPI00197B993E|nr:ribonuclease R [Mycoplasma procyoni]MBN3534477.1 ribonuclease R [Mycoplasma procyoni]
MSNSKFNLKAIQKLVSQSPRDYIFIAKTLNIARSENKEFSIFLNQKLKEFKLFVDRDSKYYYPKEVLETQGEMKLNPKGFGFVDQDEETSFFIPKPYTNTALDGDVVKITVFEDPKRPGDFFAVVNEIIQRKASEYVGFIKQNGDFFDFVPIDAKLKGRFRWDQKYSFKDGEVVKVKIKEFQNERLVISLVKRMGMMSDDFKDIEMAVEASGVIHTFNEQTLQEAKQIPQEVSEKDLISRVDLRNEVIVTIDGDDTKDFDDAISVKKLDNGNFVLGVHIADVSYYVKEGDTVDAEARNRGTSIYLANKVIPMLPFELSNGICSLNPKVDRLTLTMECEIDKQGNNVWVKFYPSVINSYARLTYKQVNRFYNNDRDQIIDDNIAELLKNALELTESIRKLKKKQGFIDFEFDEPKLVLDEHGKTIDVVIRERDLSENMIEDFMVRANENVAEYMAKKELPFIYRIHPVPEMEKIQQLNNVLKLLKINVNVPFSEDPVDFQKAIEKVKAINFDNFIKINLLRTMQKAVYSEQNVGHFGLASEFYTHFTSPIRRYPDLIVHRLLREFVFENNFKNIDFYKENLQEIALKNSMSEQSALSLEREVFAIKISEYYAERTDQVFKAQIVSIKKFGFFVELETGASALVHVSTLPNSATDEYNCDENELYLQNSKTKFTLGQWVDIKIESTSKFEGKINAILNLN